MVMLSQGKADSSLLPTERRKSRSTCAFMILSHLDLGILYT